MKSLPAISISEQLAEQFAKSIESIPASMQTLCDSLLVDTVGLCVASRNQDYLLASLRASIEPGNCTVVGHSSQVNVAAACIVNGTAIHGEDFDDTYEGGPIHAGAVIVPAILATAEQHQLSGKDILAGISVGSELMCRMCTVAPKLVHKAVQVHAYDIFKWESWMESCVKGTNLENRYRDSDDFLDAFLDQTFPWQKQIKVYQEIIFSRM
jgi:2-methylcitrate dehydratase PrpD